MRLFYFLAVLGLAWGCSNSPQPPQSGTWRGSLDLHGAELPFGFELVPQQGVYSVVLLNAEERLIIDQVRIVKDSIYITHPIFDTEFQARLSSPTHMSGIWVDRSRGPDYQIPFEANWGEFDRFALDNSTALAVEGRWECHFSPGTDDHFPAMGVFQQAGKQVKGTFLTETGDYRYLEGVAQGSQLRLSAFDGSHAFLFEAEMQDSILTGEFRSGVHWEEPWEGKLNPQFELRSPDSLTFLTPGYDRLSFEFPNTDSVMVSLDDPKYQGKVVIVQLMGTWCPNCMDESKYLAKVYDQYEKDGLEIIGLAYERRGDFQTGVRNIKKLAQRFGSRYDFLIASMSNDKAVAAQTLPMLNHILSFPTTIFLDRRGKVRKIHTGFYGPGTGDYYHRFTDETEQLIEKLLAER